MLLTSAGARSLGPKTGTAFGKIQTLFPFSFFSSLTLHRYHWAMNRATFSVPHIDYFTHYCIEHFHTHITVKHKPGTV